MEQDLDNALVLAINIVKGVYDLAEGNDEKAIRPLMQGAMQVASMLQIPYESEDGIAVDSFGALSPRHLERANKIIEEIFKEGDAE
jgi:hypothetical protein